MSNYNLIDKFFHKLIFRFNSLNNFFFDLEKFFFLNKDNFYIENSINVCGLPRSGTTTLMNAIYNSGEFGSLTYRDMPLLLSPNLWNKISSKLKK